MSSIHKLQALANATTSEEVARLLGKEVGKPDVLIKIFKSKFSQDKSDIKALAERNINRILKGSSDEGTELKDMNSAPIELMDLRHPSGPENQENPVI